MCVYNQYCANWKWRRRKDNLLLSMQSDFVSNKKKNQHGLGDTDRGWGWFPGLRLIPGLKWIYHQISNQVCVCSRTEMLELRDLQVCQWRPKRPLKKSMKSLAFIFTLFFNHADWFSALVHCWNHRGNKSLWPMPDFVGFSLQFDQTKIVFTFLFLLFELALFFLLFQLLTIPVWHWTLCISQCFELYSNKRKKKTTKTNKTKEQV